MINKLELEVIATYEDGEQEIISADLTSDEKKQNVLKSENDLLTFARNLITYPTDSDLFKLSLCWIGESSVIKKYDTIYLFFSILKDTIWSLVLSEFKYVLYKQYPNVNISRPNNGQK